MYACTEPNFMSCQAFYDAFVAKGCGIQLAFNTAKEKAQPQLQRTTSELRRNGDSSNVGEPRLYLAPESEVRAHDFMGLSCVHTLGHTMTLLKSALCRREIMKQYSA